MPWEMAFQENGTAHAKALGQNVHGVLEEERRPVGLGQSKRGEEREVGEQGVEGSGPTGALGRFRALIWGHLWRVLR